ncbi:RecE family exodeoxyribonuclease [Escherichia coli]|uniref:Exodeoxyribonuclease VIII n=1 Tax=Escherichia coli TaxID=562 RepID=A0ABD4PE90_ECOLX|nr:RecE family exodeoxyribonuclease [Escherichia coli]EEC8602322.1 exodeoxyribonuclease VIII [Escherichia coli]EEC8710220.1 exodeoxyribonuclease VIII [Escherichia coli]EEC8847284.1 exodeoxyribonuclease VIII [Escherichia coli]EEC9605045.1 exodeoxyribonuclease VIII [Escherichia coli]EED0581934.1 exodeoxyribonuclease VIII [Escherichia coli]
MSADKQTFALHCEAKNDKVRKRLGIKGGFFWADARKLSVAVSRCIAAMDDAGYDEDDFKKPVRVNFPVVNDLPPEGVFDTEFCNRYEKGGEDGITMMAIPFNDNINGEDATTAGDDNDDPDGTIPDDVEKSESPDSDDDCSECEMPVATLSLTHRFLHLFFFSKDEDGKYRHHATPEQRNQVIRLEMDTEDSYLQSLLTAVRSHPELDKLTNYHLGRLAQSVGKAFSHSTTRHIGPAEFDKFISTWMKTDYVDQGLLTKEWQKGNCVTGITRTPSGANAGGGNLTDRGEGFTHNQASLARDIATGVLARSMDVDIYNLHPAHAKRVEEIVAENKPPFSVFRDKFIAMPGGLDYSRAIVVASVKEAPIGIEAIPARVTEYLNKVLTETDHATPDPEIVDIACGRSSAPIPQRVTKEGKQDDEEKPQPSGAMADEQATTETVEPDTTEHNQDTQSMDAQPQINSVDAKYQKLRAELYEARKNIPPKNPVDTDKLLAASRREFVEGISDPTDPKWVKGSQTRDTEDQNQSKVEQNEPEAEQNSPDTQQNGPEEPQPGPVMQQEVEKVCTACGQNSGGHCPDCGPVMGDETYAETFGENETTDGDDQAQMKNEYIQENAVDTTQEHDSVVHIAPDSDASDNNDDSEQADFDWKRQLVLAAVYGLCANPACVATAPAIPDIAIMIANRLGNFGGDES